LDDKTGKYKATNGSVFFAVVSKIFLNISLFWRLLIWLTGKNSFTIQIRKVKNYSKRYPDSYLQIPAPIKKCAIALLLVFIVAGCKKPFIPQEIKSDANKYLVIEGVINGGSDSTFIKISRTQKIDTIQTVNPETNAVAVVESDANSNFKLTETTAGTYTAPPISLDGTHKYRLRITTSDHKEYLSDFVAVKNSPPIDSIGFVAQAAGVQIYVNTHDAANSTRYYRWDYTEAWQFHSKYVSTYKFPAVARQVSEQVYDCFGSDISSNVTVASTSKLSQDIISEAPITLIPSTSEKIETKYSILVKQYALTSDAYTFWENLQNNTEKLGSIFDVLPSENQSNFHCITNPNELVVGYLSVGSPATKRIFIAANQLPGNYSPVYPCECQFDTTYASYALQQQNPHALNIDIFSSANSPYMIMSGLYLPPADPFGKPTAYTYSTILCVDCTVRGTKTQPAFWK
jgi:hypothetical protein